MSEVDEMENEIEAFIADEFSFGKSYECQTLWKLIESYKQAIREEVIEELKPFLPKIYKSKLDYVEEVMSFHAEQGLHFNRTAGGGVSIVKYRQSSPQNEEVFRVVLDAESWASIVLSVSLNEESGDTFQQALDFFNGEQELNKQGQS